VCIEGKSRRIGGTGYVAHRATERAGPIQGSLRSDQDLHTLDVVHLHIDIDRDLAEISLHGIARGIVEKFTGIQRGDVEAADRHQVRCARTLIDDGQARNPPRELGEIREALPFERFAGEGGGVEGELLNVRFPPRSRYDDLLESRPRRAFMSILSEHVHGRIRRSEGGCDGRGNGTQATPAVSGAESLSHVSTCG
jgi:hypothetical protein